MLNLSNDMWYGRALHKIHHGKPQRNLTVDSQTRSGSLTSNNSSTTFEEACGSLRIRSSACVRSTKWHLHLDNNNIIPFFTNCFITEVPKITHTIQVLPKYLPCLNQFLCGFLLSIAPTSSSQLTFGKSQEVPSSCRKNEIVTNQKVLDEKISDIF